jgi:hypothetical protein
MDTIKLIIALYLTFYLTFYRLVSGYLSCDKASKALLYSPFKIIYYSLRERLKSETTQCISSKSAFLFKMHLLPILQNAAY